MFLPYNQMDWATIARMGYRGRENCEEPFTVTKKSIFLKSTGDWIENKNVLS